MGNLKISGFVALAVGLGWAYQATAPSRARAASAPDKAAAAPAPASTDPAPAPAPAAANAAPADSKPAASDSGLSVSRSALCTGVKDREPAETESKPEYSASVKALYFWTEVQAKAPPMSIQHVWYAGAEKVVAVTLAVKTPRTRTWSQQNVWPGDWRVEAIDASGAVLAEARFKVTP